jgi:Tfp pilus assembly protein PilN
MTIEPGLLFGVLVVIICLFVALFTLFLRGLGRLGETLNTFFTTETTRSRLVDTMSKEIDELKQDVSDLKDTSRYLFKLLKKDQRFHKILEADDLSGKIPRIVTRR